MAIVKFSELYPEILAAAPACPTPTILRHLRTAARNLGEQALCYQHDVGNIVVPTGQASIELDVPTETVLHKVVAITLDGKLLMPYSPVLLDEAKPNWRDESGRPLYFWRSTEEMDSIILAPTPNATFTNGIKGQVAVKPSRTATGIEEVWMDRFQDIIVDGALGELLSVRSAPWYEPGLGAFHTAKFSAMVVEAKAIGDGDDYAKRQTVRYGGL